MTNTEKLRFVIRLAQDINLNIVRPGDLLNLRDDLQRFIGVQEAVPDENGKYLKDIKDGTYTSLKIEPPVAYLPIGPIKFLVKLETLTKTAAIPIVKPFPWNYEVQDFLDLQKEANEFLTRALQAKGNIEEIALRIDPSK